MQRKIHRTLEELEADIRTKIFNFENAGKALSRVKSQKLYRKRHFMSFYRYAKKTFDLERDYADELIRGADIMEGLRSYLSEDELPKNLHHVTVLSWLKSNDERVDAYRLATEKTNRLEDPLMTLDIIKESIDEVKSMKGSLVSLSHPPRKKQIESTSHLSVPEIDSMVKTAGKLVSPEYKNMDSQNKDSGLEKYMDPSDLAQTENSISNDKLENSNSNEAQNLSPKRPHLGETIFGTENIKRKSRTLSSNISLPKDNQDVAQKVNELFTDQISSNRRELVSQESHRSDSLMTPQIGSKEGEIVIDCSAYSEMLNYRSGLISRVAIQALSFLAALEIGRQADCGCDQTLLSFGDEIAREIENKIEELILGLSDETIQKSHDIKITIEEYGQVHVVLSQEQSTFTAQILEVRIWDTYRHQISGWPLRIQDDLPSFLTKTEPVNAPQESELVEA